MARPLGVPWPTARGSIFFGDVASSATLSRAVRDGRIRRLAAGLFTADTETSPEMLVAGQRWLAVSHFIPDALVADRSAAQSGRPVEGVLSVVSNQRSQALRLPGLLVVPRKGPAPRHDDPPWAGGLRITSDARTLVDNVAVSRSRAGRPARTLRRDELEDWLVWTNQRRPDGWLEELRSRALELCDELGVPERKSDVLHLVGAVAGSRPVRAGAGPLLAARTYGWEYDPDRVSRFEKLARYLASIPPGLVPSDLRALPTEQTTSLPFFEAYFSNFIEGTEFTVEEAEEIVTSQTIPAGRPEDAHDVLGTFEAVTEGSLRASVPQTVEEMFELLERRHRLIMGGRPDKQPGRYKSRANQAGSYVFVAPGLVKGTLAEGHRLMHDVPAGFPRAAYQMFLVSEVHPFEDGNGRVARATAGAHLSAAGQSRLIIPTVFRNEYQTALRLLSREGRCELYVRTLAYAWLWTASMPWDDRTSVDGRLVSTNAMVDSTEAERSGIRLLLP